MTAYEMLQRTEWGRKVIAALERAAEWKACFEPEHDAMTNARKALAALKAAEVDEFWTDTASHQTGGIEASEIKLGTEGEHAVAVVTLEPKDA